MSAAKAMRGTMKEEINKEIIIRIDSKERLWDLPRISE